MVRETAHPEPTAEVAAREWHEMIYYVIPARRGSKGHPFKNRALVLILLPNVPPEVRPRTVVTTDEEEILAWVREQGVRVVERPAELADDHASIKPVLVHAVGMRDDDVAVMLFPTYPQRRWRDVEAALEFCAVSGAPSMCCRKQVARHPYLAYVALPDGRGRKVIEHQLYRRQDCPECFEVRELFPNQPAAPARRSTLARSIARGASSGCATACGPRSPTNGCRS
jgi:CMP-N-acetylneuraminic acid synthetase